MLIQKKLDQSPHFQGDFDCLFRDNGFSNNIAAPETGMPQFGRSDSEMNDDRIHHILTEASSMIQKPSPQQNHHHHHHLQNSIQVKHSILEDSHSIEDSKSPPNCTSPFSKRNSKKYENDDITEEKMQKIYQEELHKLMARGQRDSFPK
jgi:homeobox protein cut-like